MLGSRKESMCVGYTARRESIISKMGRRNAYIIVESPAVSG